MGPLPAPAPPRCWPAQPASQWPAPPGPSAAETPHPSRRLGLLATGPCSVDTCLCAPVQPPLGHSGHKWWHSLRTSGGLTSTIGPLADRQEHRPEVARQPALALQLWLDVTEAEAHDEHGEDVGDPGGGGALPPHTPALVWASRQWLIRVPPRIDSS